MSEQQKKSRWENNKSNYIAAGVFVLAVIILGVYAYNHQGAVTQNTQQGYSQGSSTAAPVATTTPTSTPTSTGAPGTKLSYGAAIKAYPERFQFTQCHGTPATIAVRKGTPVMLDNRNATAYTIKADTQTFRIAGYGYDVFYPEVLGNLVVTCNGKASVTLNVEK
jgi:hypothetical protein